MFRVLANATIDVLKEPDGKHVGNFKVEVWGQPPHDYVRTYEILEKSDNMAAQEGIRRFVEVMEKLDLSKD